MIFDAVAYNYFLGPDEDSQFIENKIGSRYKFDSFKMMKSLGSAVEKMHTLLNMVILFKIIMATFAVKISLLDSIQTSNMFAKRRARH